MANQAKAIGPTGPAIPQEAPSGDPGAHPLAALARLAELRDEAAETARLANLLGRTPLAAAVLAVPSVCVAFWLHDALAPLLTWLVLVGAGQFALVRAYMTAIAAPFEREPLRMFSGDLVAIMLYVGFAWGAGCFLALPGSAGLIPVLAFGAGAILLEGIALRSPEATASFAIPVTALSATAELFRPVGGGLIASATVLASGAVLVAAAFYLHHVFLLRQNPAALSISSR